ncbi:hypothetical protein J7T55_003766 [Diaporthe amygdali]|uniref:uncharacterized protein n=1 Tax=Phomopsis amygdali TaxID=1214568 RepID=UPI0022FDB997|nr:uncharacterized protein J7T55_003766 [Diaporthe amygdali]KAJ0117352.1 hypothetical protein J7T55_003766 [Diaporthe amygdali]
MAEPERRRRRPTTNCARSRTKEPCVYDQEPQPARPGPRSIQPDLRRAPGQVPRVAASATPTCPDSSATTAAEPASPATDAAQIPARNLDLMQSRIEQLEQQLYKATSRPTPAAQIKTPASEIETTSSKFAGTFHVHRTSSLFGRSELIAIPVTKNFVAIIEPYLREGKPKVLDIVDKCKTLARIIKSQRAPPWPTPPTTDLPPRHLADILVNRYLETIETVYRVLHIPSFKRDYEAIWTNPSTKPETHFIVQLKLVLALGAVTYDQNFSLRPEATRWIYEAQTYLSEPIFKPRLRIQVVQTRILLLLAMENVDVSGDSVWIAAGSLIRTVVTMGLHRDPSRLPEMTPFAAEMRRRLWNTILEISLQASISKGGPPLLSTDDFDAEAPRNIDDEALTAGLNQVPIDNNGPTSVSVARALRATYPVRLKVAKFLNDLNITGPTYEETLQLDAEVREAFKEFRRSLHPLRNQPSMKFAIDASEFIMNRYLSSLHMPYFAASLRSPAYAFSRQVVVDVLLKIWCAAWPTSSIASPTISAPTSNPTPPTGRSETSEDLLARLITCGSGFFRSVAIQVSFTIPTELHAHLQDDEGLGPTRLRRDLAAVTEEVHAWSWRCMEAGEVSVKGFLMSGLMMAQTKVLQSGGTMDGDELARFLTEEGEKAAEGCVPLLEAMVERTKQNGDGAPALVDDLGPSPGLTEDWDVTRMTDAMFMPEGQGSMSWFDTDTMPGLYFW